MCQECVDTMQTELQKRGWEPTDSQVMDFLWSATVFPFDHPGRHIREAFKKFGDLPTWDAFCNAAMADADDQMTQAAKEYCEQEAVEQARMG